MLGEVILIQEAVRLALAPPVALVQCAHGAVHSLGVFPPAEIRVGDDQADRYRLGGRAVPFPRSGLRLWDRRSRAAIGRGDERAEDHEDLDPHLFSSSSSSFLRSAGSRERGNVHSLFPISRFTLSSFALFFSIRGSEINLFFFFFSFYLHVYCDFISTRLRSAREEDRNGGRHTFSAL